MTDMLAAALAWHNAGCSVIRVNTTDRSKRPLGEWKQYMTERADVATLESWFGDGYPGMGVVCGAISGNLEMFEFEGRATELFDPFIMQLAAINAELASTILSYMERTPSGGLHLYYRIEGSVVQTTKLAQRPLAGGGKETLIETRGDGGQSVVAPSHFPVYNDGDDHWIALHGTCLDIPTITQDEYELIHSLALTFDECPPDADVYTSAYEGEAEGAPGDDFNKRESWDFLEQFDYTKWHTQGNGAQLWSRPGKRFGASIITGGSDQDLCYVFSSSCFPLEDQKAYSKWRVLALLKYNGDFSRCASELRKAGYGAKTAKNKLVFEAIAMGSSGESQTVTTEDNEELIPVNNSANAAAWLLSTVGSGKLSGLFMRNGKMVHTPRIGESGYVPDDRLERDDTVQVQPIDLYGLQARVSVNYQCVKLNKKKDDKDYTATPALFPLDSSRVVSSIPDMCPNLRQLNGVTHTPTMSKYGTVISTPGYDQDSGLMYLPDHGLIVPEIPDRPTQQDAINARTLIDYMLQEFDWATPRDRSNYYGALLTPLIRELVPPPYKQVVITAPQKGSGKSLLAHILRVIHGGVFRAEMPEDSAELRKQITSILDGTTGPVIHIDNITGVVRSSILAGLLTSKEWSDRRLGNNEMPKLKNDRLWVFTGNNVTIGGDLDRRTLWVTIDPKMAHPEQRTGFTIDNLWEWATRNRGALIYALLIMIRAWYISDHRVKVRSSDDYGEWVASMSGILSYAGIVDEFDSNDDEKKQQLGEDDEDWRRFLVDVFIVMGSEAWTVEQLFANMQQFDMHENPQVKPYGGVIPISSLPGKVGEKIDSGNRVGAKRSLGLMLKYNKGRWAGDFSVDKCNEKSNSMRTAWKVQTSLIAQSEDQLRAALTNERSGQNHAMQEVVRSSLVAEEVEEVDREPPKIF